MASATQSRGRLIREITRNTSRRNNSTTSSITSHGTVNSDDLDPRHFDPDNEANDQSTRRINVEDLTRSDNVSPIMHNKPNLPAKKTVSPIMQKKPNLPAKVPYRFDKDAFHRSMAFTFPETSEDGSTLTSDISIEVGRGDRDGNRSPDLFNISTNANGNTDMFPMGGNIRATDLEDNKAKKTTAAQSSNARAFGKVGNSRAPLRSNPYPQRANSPSAQKENADPVAQTATHTMSKARNSRFVQQPQMSSNADSAPSFLVPAASKFSEIAPAGKKPSVAPKNTTLGDKDAGPMTLGEKKLLAALYCAQDEAAGLRAQLRAVYNGWESDEATGFNGMEAEVARMESDLRSENAALRAEIGALKLQLEEARKGVHDTSSSRNSLFSVGPSPPTANQCSGEGAKAPSQTATWLTQVEPEAAQGVRGPLEQKRASKKTSPARAPRPAEENMTSAFIIPDFTLSKPFEQQGKKGKVTIPRPVPVSQRIAEAKEDELDITMRPSQAPGIALAVTIKKLEDELQHHKTRLSEEQARYNQIEAGLSRRERSRCHRKITKLLQCCERTADMIYALYDVLEGQKATGTGMTQEEVDITMNNLKDIFDHQPEGDNGTGSSSKPSSNRSSGQFDSFVWGDGPESVLRSTRHQ